MRDPLENAGKILRIVKAEAVRKTLRASETTNLVPATLLREHPEFILYLDTESAAEVMA